mmetsp:Transcript_11928/g.38875  ORF Transcript_11928/g.38875 Transcript_11928/m.38875 type:complete len:244 (+) Transcript_11928:44-775(+)
MLDRGDRVQRQREGREGDQGRAEAAEHERVARLLVLGLDDAAHLRDDVAAVLDAVERVADGRLGVDDGRRRAARDRDPGAAGLLLDGQVAAGVRPGDLHVAVVVRRRRRLEDLGREAHGAAAELRREALHLELRGAGAVARPAPALGLEALLALDARLLHPLVVDLLLEPGCEEAAFSVHELRARTGELLLVVVDCLQRRGACRWDAARVEPMSNMSNGCREPEPRNDSVRRCHHATILDADS